MSSYKEEVEEFINGEENLYSFEIKQTTEDKIKLSIDGDFDFTVKVLEKGKFEISSEEEFLADWCKTVNAYCNQGKKTMEDLLLKASDAYTDLMASPKEEQEVIYPTDDVILPIIQTKEEDKPKISFEEMSNFKKMFNVESTSNKTAVDRLMKDYIELCKTDHSDLGFSAEPINGNLFKWEVRLFDFEKSVCPEFVKDLQTYAKNHNGQDYVKLEMVFLPDYPYKPPFIRVISPRFAFHTGRVTVGGSICFELLTGSGWAPSNSLESIFLQIKLEMNNGKPRIDWTKDYDYSESEAKQAFFRVAGDHGWDTSGLK